jgi:type IV secretion system protein TrbL
MSQVPFRKGFVVAPIVALAFMANISQATAGTDGRADDDCSGSNFMFDFACEVKGAVVDAATAPVRYAANSAVDAVTSWVADTAQWIVGKVISFIDTSTSPALNAGWFAERYQFMIGLAALVLLPMLLMATIRAVVTQDISQLFRSFFVHLPVAVLGTFTAVVVTNMLLSITDSLSEAVADGIAGDVSEIFDSVGTTLGASGGVPGPGAPSFAIFFVSLLLILGSFFVWLELLVRSAAVTVSVFFLPMILAALVWPATAHWTRRMIETLVALILSKFVIVAVISLATAALAEPGGGGFGSVMGGTALMLMAAFSPMVLLKLMPVAEGAAIGHLQGVGRRPLEMARPGSSTNQAIATMRARMTGTRTQGLAGPTPRTAGLATSAPVAATAAAATAVKSAAKAPGEKLKKQVDIRGTERGVDTRPKNTATSAPVKPPKSRGSSD